MSTRLMLWQTPSDGRAGAITHVLPLACRQRRTDGACRKFPRFLVELLGTELPFGPFFAPAGPGSCAAVTPIARSSRWRSASHAIVFVVNAFRTRGAPSHVHRLCSVLTCENEGPAHEG